MKPTLNALRLLGLAPLVFAATLQAQRTTFDDTKTRQALPLDTPPVIDGVVDPGEWDQAYTSDWRVIYDANPNLTDGIRGGNFGDVKGPLTGAPDLGFQIWAGYDSTNLYIRVRVTDDVISSDTVGADSANGTFWVDDAVEVFIDGDNSNNPTRDNNLYVDAGKASTNSFQFAITANNGYFEWQTFLDPTATSAYGADKAWFARASPLADGTGYEAEFRISLAAIGNPKPGDIVGFNVAVDDDDDGAGIERQVHWSGLPHVESGWGNLLFGRRSYQAPRITTAPTINGTIAPGEYAGATEIKINPHTAIFDIGSGDDEFPLGDNGYSAWVVHDADAVYVAIDVLDDQVFTDTAAASSEDGMTWEDDSVEIFFDVNLDRLGGRETAFEGQYVFTANGAWRDNEAGNPTFGAANDWFAATSRTAGGYQVEFKIKKSALNNPVDGATLGFNIAQNDDDGAGRKAQLGWSGRAHNEITYGTLTLGGSGIQTPTLSIARTPAGVTPVEVTVTFTGTLQSATQVAGPYTNVTGATSPHSVPPDGSMKFYRAVR
jgi:cellulose/xylan binding protein with CBM9 domain